MYRILMAINGSYYVQDHSGWNGWSKIGGFFKTRAGARRFIRDHQALKRNSDYLPPNRVVEYIS